MARRFLIALALAVASLFPAAAQDAGKTDDAMTDRLFSAAAADDLATLRGALDAGVAIDTRDPNGRTALLIATRANAVNAARLLIENGADVDARDAIDDSPFLYAGAEGRLEILKLTVAAGADLVSTNRYGGTALIPAAHHGHVETVRYLLTTKIDIDHVNNLGWTALLEAVILGDGGRIYQDIVTLLVEAGADAAIADRDGVTPLQHAQNRGFAEIVRILEDSKGR